MNKELISNSYINKQKNKHDWKKSPPRYDRNIAITGSKNEGSIGEEIFKRVGLSVHVDADVTVDNLKFSGFTDLIMCHGYTHLDWIEDLKDDKIKEIIDVNLYGSIRMIQQFVQQTIYMPYRKKIISIGSMAYNHVLNGSSVYCASKAGLNHFIKCAAWELAPKGFDVYIIHPSNVVDTPMTKDTINHLMRYRNLSFEDATEYWSASLPRNSFLTKKEIAQHVNYLLFNETGYLSGCPIELAGGQR